MFTKIVGLFSILVFLTNYGATTSLFWVWQLKSLMSCLKQFCSKLCLNELLEKQDTNVKILNYFGRKFHFELYCQEEKYHIHPDFRMESLVQKCL